MSQSKLTRITDYLNQRDATFACPILVDQGAAVLSCLRGQCIAFVLCDDCLEPSQQARDLAARIEESEGRSYFIQDWLDVKQALEEISEIEDDTAVCLCGGDDD
jgi:hypothetical protein